MKDGAVRPLRGYGLGPTTIGLATSFTSTLKKALGGVLFRM
jgi:hypothetical protein